MQSIWLHGLHNLNVFFLFYYFLWATKAVFENELGAEFGDELWNEGLHRIHKFFINVRLQLIIQLKVLLRWHYIGDASICTCNVWVLIEPYLIHSGSVQWYLASGKISDVMEIVPDIELALPGCFTPLLLYLQPMLWLYPGGSFRQDDNDVLVGLMRRVLPFVLKKCLPKRQPPAPSPPFKIQTIIQYFISI